MAHKQDNLGLGLGLRNTHFQHIVETWPKVDWFEAISENFMDSGGRPRYILDQIAERYPIVLHGVSMSIGSCDPLNIDYLSKLKKLARSTNARWISDHLCWTGVHAINSHDLLPVPLNDESLQHIITRINHVQDFLGQRLILENPSTYLTFKQSTIAETTFLSELVKATDCGLLLDVNNVFVSCFNNNTDPFEYLQDFPLKAVVQLHLAGHSHCGTHIIDTHDKPVSPEVWALFKQAWSLLGDTSVLLEWDGDIPDFDTCMAELNQAKNYMNDADDTPSTQAPFVNTSQHVSTPINFLVPEVMNDTVEAIVE